ncbi:hypothetical protein NL676_036106 [Syzygium grande]|nr:hypothetical protein NL676_036106 [Syzygium grande]
MVRDTVFSILALTGGILSFLANVMEFDPLLDAIWKKELYIRGLPLLFPPQCQNIDHPVLCPATVQRSPVVVEFVPESGLFRAIVILLPRILLFTQLEITKPVPTVLFFLMSI